MFSSNRVPALANTRVLVLGGSGFIGQWLVAELRSEGAAPWVVVRDASSLQRANGDGVIQVIEQDLTDDAAVERVFSSVRPAACFNCIGYGVDRGECDPARAEFLNSRLPELLVRLACKHADFSWSGQQVVHLSSDFERSAPSTLYGGTKAAGASNFVRACHALGVRGVAARLFTVYGPGERSDRLLPALLGLLDTSDDLPLTDGLQQRDFTYVEDVSQGLLRLAASPAKSGEIVDLGSGRITTVREFATTVARLGGISPARLRFGALRRRVEDQRTVTAVPADTKRLRELTGWIPATTIEEGIRRTLRRQLAHSQSLTG